MDPGSSVVYGGRTSDERHKLKQDRFRLNIRTKFFILRTAMQWSKLPRKVVQAPALQITRNNWIKP